MNGHHSCHMNHVPCRLVHQLVHQPIGKAIAMSHMMTALARQVTALLEVGTVGRSILPQLLWLTTSRTVPRPNGSKSQIVTQVVTRVHWRAFGRSGVRYLYSVRTLQSIPITRSPLRLRPRCDHQPSLQRPTGRGQSDGRSSAVPGHGVVHRRAMAWQQAQHGPAARAQWAMQRSPTQPAHSRLTPHLLPAAARCSPPVAHHHHILATCRGLPQVPLHARKSGASSKAAHEFGHQQLSSPLHVHAHVKDQQACGLLCAPALHAT